MAKRERRHASFLLDALMVVEMDVSVDQIISFAKGSRFVPVEAFRFEDGEEVFSHRIVIRIPSS